MKTGHVLCRRESQEEEPHSPLQGTCCCCCSAVHSLALRRSKHIHGPPAFYHSTFANISMCTNDCPPFKLPCCGTLKRPGHPSHQSTHGQHRRPRPRQHHSPLPKSQTLFILCLVLATNARNFILLIF